MKKLLFVAVCLISFVAPACAYQAPGNFKLSLWEDTAFSIPDNIYNIKGADLGIGSKSYTLTGLQWDILWANSTYLTGLSWAWAASKTSKATGAQMAFVTLSDQITGAQLGAVNLSFYDVVGAQIGFYNQAERITGAQVGFVNYAKHIHGLQLGIFNIAENGYLPAMVFVNGRF